MQSNAKPDFFVGDMCIINKLVGDMHQKTSCIANSCKQTVLVNKQQKTNEERHIKSDGVIWKVVFKTMIKFPLGEDCSFMSAKALSIHKAMRNGMKSQQEDQIGDLQKKSFSLVYIRVLGDKTSWILQNNQGKRD